MVESIYDRCRVRARGADTFERHRLIWAARMKSAVAKMRQVAQTTPRATMTEIKFGTDGWRAVIAEGFTFANVSLSRRRQQIIE
jgi:hypothetical protein